MPKIWRRPRRRNPQGPAQSKDVASLWFDLARFGHLSELSSQVVTVLKSEYVSWHHVHYEETPPRATLNGYVQGISQRVRLLSQNLAIAKLVHRLEEPLGTQQSKQEEQSYVHRQTWFLMSGQRHFSYEVSRFNWWSHDEQFKAKPSLGGTHKSWIHCAVIYWQATFDRRS